MWNDADCDGDGVTNDEVADGTDHWIIVIWYGPAKRYHRAAWIDGRL
ncbi:MAG: hypothetical protein R2793_08950 [Flavobacteriaceae bacterium]